VVLSEYCVFVFTCVCTRIGVQSLLDDEREQHEEIGSGTTVDKAWLVVFETWWKSRYLDQWSWAGGGAKTSRDKRTYRKKHHQIRGGKLICCD
jgi:hypothetical protein